MATISDARATYGLAATGTPTSTGVSGSVQIGTGTTQMRFTTADVAYSVRAILCSSSDTFTISPSTSSTSGSTAFVAGAAQVETATAAGTIGTSGNATVVVTAAGMTGSPKTVSVAVTSGDTAAVWAGKVSTALAADADVSALFTVGGSTTAISLTRLPTNTFTVPGGTLNLYAANDATLNISIDNGTCTGITTAATSADTTAGVVSSGVKIYDGDGKDFEGDSIVSAARMFGILVSTSSTSSVAPVTSLYSLSLEPSSSFMMICDSTGGMPVGGTINIGSDDAVVDVTLTIISKSS